VFRIRLSRTCAYDGRLDVIAGPIKSDVGPHDVEKTLSGVPGTESEENMGMAGKLKLRDGAQCTVVGGTL
jgi:hypothetical protein